MKAPLPMLAAVLALSSCHIAVETKMGPPVEETKSATFDKIEMLSAEVRMAGGELRVGSSAAKEAKAKFRYTKNAAQPRFAFDGTSFRGRLVVDQADQTIKLAGASENHWDLTLAEGIPTDLDIKMGAGEAKLELGRLDLRGVALRMGAGSVRADFRGAPKRDYEIRIEGGVGDCEVYLPREAGIRAEAKGGIGSIDVSGLEKRGDTWENQAFSASGPKIRLSIKGGVGRIQIIAN